MALTRIGTDNIEDLSVEKVDLNNKVIDAFKLDVEGWQSGDLLSVDNNGNLLFISPSEGGGMPRLGELIDVTLTNNQDGDTILWDDDAQQWINGAPPNSLSELTDTTITAPILGNFLGFDGNDWINRVIEYADIQNVPPVDYDDIINTPTIPVNGDFTFVGLSDTFDTALPNAFVRWSGDGSTLIYETTIDSSVISGLATVATSGLYNDLNDIPTAFPPGAHKHIEADITGLDKYTKKEVDDALAGKAELVHTHVEADITDLNKYTQEEVDGLIAGVPTFSGSYDDLTDVPTEFPPSAHIHVEADITDLNKYTQEEVNSRLENKNDKVIDAVDGNFAGLDVTGQITDSGFSSTSFAEVVHTHNQDDITDLYDFVYNKTEVDSFLSNKSDVGHTHVMADITDSAWLLNINNESIDELNDVTLNAPVSGNVLIYSGTNWENGSYSYGDLSGVPTEFPPSAHIHVEADITDLDKYTTTEVDDALAGKADVSHTHVMADITDSTWISDISGQNIRDALDVQADSIQNGEILSWNGSEFIPASNVPGVTEFIGLQDVPSDYIGNEGLGLVVNGTADGLIFTALFSGSYGDLTEVPTEFPPSAHTHVEADITDLDKYTTTEVDALIAGVPTFSGSYGDLTDVPTEFPPSAHTHVEADITDLDKYTQEEVDDALALKANLSSVPSLLNDLSDVIIDTPLENQVLIYDGSDFGNGSISYQLLTDVPDTFPPSAHTHTIAQVGNLQDELDLKTNDDTLASVAKTGSYASLIDAPEIITILNDLNDVNTTGVTEGQVLTHVSGVWVPRTPSEGGGSSTFRELTDTPDSYVDTDRQILVSDESNNGLVFSSITESDINNKADKVTTGTTGNLVEIDDNGNLVDSGSSVSDFATTISDLNDVVVTSPQVGDSLEWDGTQWVNTDVIDGGTF